ncbi:hypothetical protein ABVK25_007453 [Lepraria finkii]|uniref:6-phosphogluconate dehydrogenase C-terminal domain-like protein n=1 Tax=Lepraria finkii TaxID=1340010 RepID=A0ABR4B5W4_9LECA
MPPPLATIGIASVGEMGAGIAKLLSAHNYRVITNVSDRSESTRQRARAVSIELVESDKHLIQEVDYILSIVPPRDAVSTAEKMLNAFKLGKRALRRERGLCYVDLNAISPKTAMRIAERFEGTDVSFVDGGIIGAAPKLQADGSWTKPSLVVSGPHKLDSQLAETLNVKHVADTIGPASGLKMCFASTTKGLTAIAIQSFTTAHRLGMLDRLQGHLKEYSPKTGELAAKGLVGMPPKAYRWVDEMKEIAETMHDEGGFEKDLFSGVSEIFRFVADETELGKEKTESRRLGKTPEDVARVVGEGMSGRKEKVE